MFINDEAQKQVLPVLARTTTVNPSADLQQRAGALLQMNPGQQVKAEIIANLPNSLYLARIAGELYQLEIPLNVQPGETMDMTFVTAEPRITFQILRSPDGGVSVKLSSMGRWLSNVAMGAGPMEGPQEPLLEGAPQVPALLAERLKAALTQVGLFYESHLAQWAAGGLQLSELLKEPQGKLSRIFKGRGGREENRTEGEEIADPGTLPIVKEQLLLLNSGVLNWKGEAWPGQGMEIAIRQGSENEEGSVEADLSLLLPHLGGVRAKLALGREGLSLELVCDQPGVAQTMREEGDRLRSSLAAAGVSLTRMAAKDVETDS
ncbi:flagellar hook-length control protein FliK [Geomonas sp. Red32]|uniref:flagellar hook-length control protein FliK n=1 Tax=Geomonas sp. Red32 TaxID=2912856 RepID=UPI00202CF5F8|nr:flagellar hook-length control protein FliK [Geomonas sp. Red32]MCM0081720.1 flagellar hook-length control protein FliK [Geomonas sp. Red32]